MKWENPLLLLFLLVFGQAGLYAQANPKPLKIYSKDGISVKAFDYKTFEPYLKKQNDTTYVVNFWATWCAPCVAELPNFEKLNVLYKNKKVKVILVSLDMKKQVETGLLPFIKRKKLNAEVVFLDDPDANSWIEKVDFSWSGALPATLIYHRDSRHFYEKSFTLDELEQAVKRILIKDQ